VDIRLADAAALPFEDADLAIAFMSLNDHQRHAGCRAGSRTRSRTRWPFLRRNLHPINSAGRFEATVADEPAPFVIKGKLSGNV
jgi:hypothetical protein